MSRVFSIVLSKLLFILNFIFHSLSEIDSLSRLQLRFLKNKTKHIYSEGCCSCKGVSLLILWSFKKEI